MTGTPKILVDANPPVPISDPTTGVSGPGDIRERREALFRQHDMASAPENTIDLAAAVEASLDAEFSQDEGLDFIMVDTPAGEVEFGPPSGVSVTLRIANIMGETNPNRLQMAMLRTVLAVRSIGGKRISPISNMVEAQYLANMLGDSVLDFLYVQLLENWPPPRKGVLQVLRKNKRGT